MTIDHAPLSFGRNARFVTIGRGDPKLDDAQLDGHLGALNTNLIALEKDHGGILDANFLEPILRSLADFFDSYRQLPRPFDT